jgi:hypothetical protein
MEKSATNPLKCGKLLKIVQRLRKRPPNVAHVAQRVILLLKMTVNDPNEASKVQ